MWRERIALNYIDALNDDDQPFVWTAHANTILGRIDKNRAVLSKSAHEPGRIGLRRNWIHAQ